MARYRKKPQEVEAWQVGSEEPMPEWVRDVVNAPAYGYGAVVVMTFDEPLTAFAGDWIVASDGEAWRAWADDFEQAYEPAVEPTCPDCGKALNTNWGHCPECGEWREL